MNTKNSPVIIIGMHRSGTTLLSNQLNKMGLFTGKSLGIHGEANFFVKLNDWLLKQTASSWDKPKNIEKIYIKEQEEEFKSFKTFLIIMLESILKYKYFGLKHLFFKRKKWGFKDPVNSLTLPFWLSIYPNAKILFIKRHGIDVSNSLEVRNKNKFNKNLNRLKSRWIYRFYLIYSQYFKNDYRNRGFVDSINCKDFDYGIELWDYYNDKCYKYLDSIEESNKYELKYEDLLLSPDRILLEINNFLNLEFSAEKIKEISKDINPKRAYSYRKNSNLEKEKKYKKVLEKHGY